MIVGYVCVPPSGDEPVAQISALKAAGIETLYHDARPGSLAVRPELARLLDTVGPGDLVLVSRLFDLAHHLADLVEVVSRLEASGAHLRSLAENLDTTGPTCSVVFHVFSALAEFERHRVADRTLRGLRAAQRAGKSGRPHALSEEQRIEVRRLRDEENFPPSELARKYGVSVSTVRRV